MQLQEGATHMVKKYRRRVILIRTFAAAHCVIFEVAKDILRKSLCVWDNSREPIYVAPVSGGVPPKMLTMVPKLLEWLKLT